MTDEFFADDNTDTKDTPEVTKIKVGDKEYTQDELQEKIGLSDRVKDLEGKWNTKIDRLMPEYTKATQERESFRKENEELKKTKQAAEVKMDKAGLTDEEKSIAKKQLYEIMGDEPLTKKEFESAVNQRVFDILGARDLVESVDDIVAEAKEAGKPATTREDLISYMKDTGERNPEWAYRKMFDKELKGWEGEQLKKAKPSPFATITRSAPGGDKTPPPVRPTRENMSRMVKDILARE